MATKAKTAEEKCHGAACIPITQGREQQGARLLKEALRMHYQGAGKHRELGNCVLLKRLSKPAEHIPGSWDRQKAKGLLMVVIDVQNHLRKPREQPSKPGASLCVPRVWGFHQHPPLLLLANGFWTTELGLCLGPGPGSTEGRSHRSLSQSPRPGFSLDPTGFGRTFLLFGMAAARGAEEQPGWKQ